MSATRKGNVLELEVKKILEKDGWSVFRQHRKPMFMHGKMITVGADIFGVDIVAKKPTEKNLWVQVATRPNKSHKIKQVMIHPWNFAHDTVQLWLRTDGKREYEIFEAPDFGSVGVRRVI